MIRRPPRSTQSRSSAASDVYKRQGQYIDGLSPHDGLSWLHRPSLATLGSMPVEKVDKIHDFTHDSWRAGSVKPAQFDSHGRRRSGGTLSSPPTAPTTSSPPASAAPATTST